MHHVTVLSATVAGLLLAMVSMSVAAPPSSPGALPDDEFCPCEFQNVYYLCHTCCTGYTLLYSGICAPGDPVCQECDLTHMWAKVTRDSDSMVMDYEYTDGPIDCGAQKISKQVSVDCPATSDLWYQMLAHCGPCVEPPEEL